MKTKNTTQRGAAQIVGIVVIACLLLAAITFAFLALTQKEGSPQLVPHNTTAGDVSAEDLLTAGNSDNELATDYRIIEAGIKKGMIQMEAAKAVLDDEQLPVGDGVTTATTVEAERLSQLQTEYIAEADRRIEKLDEAAELAGGLTTEQEPASDKTIEDEITALTGLKAKAAAATTKEDFLKERENLEEEYVNYLMAIAQVQLLLWANDQQVLAEKVNVLGGKLQERLNEASNSGKSIAAIQTLLNSYQTNKTTAKETNAGTIKALMAVEPNTFDANRAVLVGHYEKLSDVHDEVEKAWVTSKDVILQVRAL